MVRNWQIETEGGKMSNEKTRTIVTHRDDRPPRAGEGISRASDVSGTKIGEGVAEGNVSEIWSGLTEDLEETTSTPLPGTPGQLKVDDVPDPGATNAPKIATEAPRAVRGNSIPEHRGADLSRLPETIDASRDLSNPDGCAEGGWWRR
jgi:hypothetical protein